MSQTKPHPKRPPPRPPSQMASIFRGFSTWWYQIRQNYPPFWPAVQEMEMEKIFKQKNFKNLVWAPLGSRVNICIHFCLQVHFKVSAAWYCSHYLPPVSMTPVADLPPVSLITVAICYRCRWHQWQMEISSKIKVLIILFGHLWEVELTYRYIFAFKFTLRS